MKCEVRIRGDLQNQLKKSRNSHCIYKNKPLVSKYFLKPNALLTTML